MRKQKTTSSPLIHFQNVSVRRDQHNALKNFNLKIFPHEHLAILGPNGSGKSTLIKTMVRELYPTAGKLTLFGEEQWNIDDLQKHLGWVSDDVQNSVIENVAGRPIPGLEMVLSGFFNSVGVWASVTPAMIKQARILLQLLGATHLANQPTTKLSAGEKRRILIARALVRRPKTLLLDEPMNSLDIKATSTIRKTLQTISASGKNLIIVTHRLDDIIRSIERVVLLKNGTVFREGPKELMLTEKNLSALFDTSVHVSERNGLYSWCAK